MKKVSNIRDEKLREEQFETLIDVLHTIKNRDGLAVFMGSFLTDSEKAYLGQRLNIMRMLAKNFNYLKIKEILKANNGTISHSQKCLDKGGDQLKKIVLQYKYKPKVVKADRGAKPLASTHYPGSIL